MAFGIDLSFHNFVQGDIRLQDASFDQLDAIVSQPFQIGTEVVATLADVSVVGTNEINLDLSSIFNVGGDVTISNNDQLVSIDLSHLLSVGGNFTLTNNGALLTISLPSLTTVSGSVAITGNTAATTIDAGSLTTVSGSTTISDNTSAGSISLPNLTSSGSVSIANNTSATTIDAGSLTTVSGSVAITGNTAATTIDAGSLTTVSGSVSLTGDTSLISIDLSALISAGAVAVSNDGVVTLDMSKLVSAGGDVSITGNTHLLTVDLGSLDTTAGNVTITSGADATLDASALGPGGGTVKLIGSNLATTIELGSLAHMQGTLMLSSADGVTLTSQAGLAVLDLTGTGHDDTLIGSLSAKNVIDGAAGNDIMSGGVNDDTFAFEFSVGQHIEYRDITETVHHHDFVSLADLTSVTIGGTTYSRPAPTASITAWNNWNAELTAYAHIQQDDNGGDDFVSFTNSNPGKASKTVGTIQLIDGYYHNYDTTEVLPHQPVVVTDLSGSGFDTITNFGSQSPTVIAAINGAGGNDTLLFNGLSADQTALNYWGSWLDSATADGNTTIRFHDIAHKGADVSTITLLGVTTDVASLVAQNIIKFSNPSV